MNKFTFLLLFLAPLMSLSAQTVTVLSADDGKPIADVAVYNEARTQFGYTNYSGKVSLSGFSGEQPVFFQHFSYERVSFTTEELMAAKWVVKLETKTFEVEEFIVSAKPMGTESEEVPNHIKRGGAPGCKDHESANGADLISMGGRLRQRASSEGKPHDSWLCHQQGAY